MNRPKIDDYVDLELKLTEEGVFDFVTDLISYCDELEKREQPMKVNKKKVDCREIKVGSGTFRTIYLWSCPKCETWISPSHDENYCSKCGQRLKYEDDE